MLDTLNKGADFVGKSLPILQAMPRWFQIGFLVWLAFTGVLIVVGIGIWLFNPPTSASPSFVRVTHPLANDSPLLQIGHVMPGGADDVLALSDNSAYRLRTVIDHERKRREFQPTSADHFVFVSGRLVRPPDSLRIGAKPGVAAWCAVGFLVKVGADSHRFVPPVALSDSLEFSKDDLADVSIVIVWTYPLTKDAETALASRAFAESILAEEWVRR
ncbi:MAG: hypothetical protein SynsKO_34630 [Synoicihabitans sp.]